MTWYLWLVVGILLAGLELTGSGGFYLVFFGLGALIVGILGFLRLVDAVWLQWLVFTAVSVVSLLLFRNPLLRRLQSPATGSVDRMIGEVASPLEDIPAGAVGRAELRGTTWSARNATAHDIAKGRRCRVERVDGLMLFIVPE
jgi:membrane protein implicated in regulation of membrane protease activity